MTPRALECARGSGCPKSRSPARQLRVRPCVQSAMESDQGTAVLAKSKSVTSIWPAECVNISGTRAANATA